MKILKITICAGLILAGSTLLARRATADDQTKPGAGNAAAIALARRSPIVQSAYQFLLGQAARIEDAKLRKETLDALGDPCIHHRANLTDAQKDAIVATLTEQGLFNPADAAAIVGGVKAGIFPPVLNDGSACPKLPQAFYSAPGSASVNGHPAFVITQASAHSAPTNGNEYKVVNWLRAGAIIARIDPVAEGYLMVDKLGHFRLPALRQLGNNVDLANQGQTNVLAEYNLHNLSDADFTYSGPAVIAVNTILQTLAPDFGFNPADPGYLRSFRNPVFSFLTAERLMIIYSEKGSDGVRAEVQKVRDAGAI
jgi:hypothetical protein